MSNKKFSITIPRRSVYSALIFLVILGFTILNAIYYLLPGFKEIFFLEMGEFTFYPLGLSYIPLIAYILISLNVCFFIRIFKELKEYSEKGLIYRLGGGLIFGLIDGLIFGLIGGLISGLIGGLIFGLIDGLNEEFKN